jgi:hypothetical protein
MLSLASDSALDLAKELKRRSTHLNLFSSGHSFFPLKNMIPKSLGEGEEKGHFLHLLNGLCYSHTLKVNFQRNTGSGELTYSHFKDEDTKAYIG